MVRASSTPNDLMDILWKLQLLEEEAKCNPGGQSLAVTEKVLYLHAM
jgi:hypothetical protein